MVGGTAPSGPRRTGGLAVLGRRDGTSLHVGPATLPLWHLRVEIGTPDAELGPVVPNASRGLSGLGGRGSVGEGGRAREGLPGRARHDPAAGGAAPDLGQILPRALRQWAAPSRRRQAAPAVSRGSAGATIWRGRGLGRGDRGAGLMVKARGHMPGDSGEGTA